MIKLNGERERVMKRLALYGGEKVRKMPMPTRMAFGDVEFQAVRDVFDYYRGMRLDFGYQGKFEKLYTDAFVRYMGVPGYADAVCTGTASLFVAIASLDLKAGSHVMVSPVTDPGTINAIILNRLVPVLADSSPNSYKMDVEAFRSRITSETRAVVVVHVAGKPSPVDRICAIAKGKGIYVIEDCSQAHGAKLNGKKVGTFGDIAAFSTMYRKAHATGGCGGVIFTQNEKFYNLSRAHADRGKPFFKDDFNEKEPSSFLFPALNLNIDEISCAIGLISLAKIENMIQKRVSFLEALSASIAKDSRVCSLDKVSRDDSPFFHSIFVDVPKISCSKKEFAQAVMAEGIDINPDYRYVVCEWEWAKPYLYDDFECPNAIRFRNGSFNLLLNENYGKEEVWDITNAILKVEEVYKKQ